MTTSPRVCTVILNWNQPAMTLDCVRHLLATQPVAARDVLVIDNGSSPANATLLREGLPTGVGLLHNKRNLGFAGGMNVGIDRALRAGAEYVWLLNNDAFPRSGCLSALIAAMDADQSLAAVTPLLFYPDGRPQLIGGRFEWGSLTIEPFLATQLPQQAVAGVYATGAAFFMRAAAVRQVGPLDPRFFAYWEEVDLCTRLVRGNWNLASVSKAKCVHFEGATSGPASPFTDYMFVRNCYLMAYNHLPARRSFASAVRLTAEVFDRAVSLERSQPAKVPALLAGVSDGLRRRFGPPPVGRLDAAWMHKLLFWKPWRTLPLLRRLAVWLNTGYRPPVED